MAFFDVSKFVVHTKRLCLGLESLFPVHRTEKCWETHPPQVNFSFDLELEGHQEQSQVSLGIQSTSKIT
jgi:hypothetical protein